MTIRGNDWPIDPTNTSGTELATVLNRMVDALDSTNHTDNTGDRPDYAVKGTLWLDGDVSEQNLGLKMYTGAADALLFDINDQTGAVSHTWRQVDLHDPDTPEGIHARASIRQVDYSTEFWSADPDNGGVDGIRAMSCSLFGLNVDGKLNVGYAATTAVNAMSIKPRDNGGVQFYVTDADAVNSRNIRLMPGKLSGGLINTAESLNMWTYGWYSSIALIDGSEANGETGFYCGNPLGPYFASMGNDGGNNGANSMSLQVNRNASNSNFAKYTTNGSVVSRISATGQVYGTGPYVDLSDADSKTVAEDIGLDAESVVMGLNVRRFTRNGSDAEEIGFVANEVQSVLPNAVVSFEGETYKQDEINNRSSFYRRVHGEEPTPSALSDIPALDAPEQLGLQKDQINAVLLAHVQDLTRRLAALENK